MTVLTRYRFRMIRSAAAFAVGLGIATSASAQLPSNGQLPKYYQGNVGQTPSRPPVEALPKPKFTTPVIAGADGVRPVSASEAEALKPDTVKAPTFFPPTGEGSPADPKSSAIPERPGLKPAEPAKLAIPGAPPVQVIPSSATGLPNLPSVSAMSSRQTPAVTVEFETPDSSGVGQPLTYVLVVRNTGTSAVANVRVEEETPAGTAFIGAEPSAEASNEAKLTWALGGMEAGTEKRIKVTVKPADEGEIHSRATVSFSTAVEAKVKITRPKLSISITAPDVVRVGETVPFRVTVNNVGTGPAVKIPLQARFTDGLKYRNDKGEAIDGLIETEWANLPAGQSKSFVLNLASLKSGSQQCVLTVFADGNPAETCKAAVTLVEPQLVAKQSGPMKCLVKAEPTYQIDLTNPGTATTDPISAWTTVPEGFEFVSSSDAGVFTPTTKAVMWRLAGLPAGGSKSVTIKLRAVAPAETTIHTVVQSVAPETTPTPGVAQAAVKARMLEVRCDTAVKAEGVPALRFEVVGLEGVVEVGKEAVYEIKVTNQGTGACTNVQLEAELADGTAAAGAAGPTTGRTTGQRIVFDPIASLTVKGEAIYKVRVKGNAAGDMRFRVKLGCDQVKTPSVKEENTRFYKE
jgi:uncharacterized repeat protein (TIGR01451 family)